MRQPDPDWKSLAEQPFAQWIPESVLKYRAHEVRALLKLREENPIEGPVEVEIGSNRGRFLKGLCKGQPDVSFVGVELKSGIAKIAARRLARHGLDNGRVINGDARLVLPIFFPERSIRAIYVLFPDPWWKARHEKRRFVDEWFMDFAHWGLEDEGALVIKTDVAAYARRVRALVRETGRFERVEPDVIAGSEHWVPTTRERHCLEDGLPVHGVYARPIRTP